MMSVNILINGNPILTRSCWEIKGEDGECEYQVDDGRIIKHNYNNGAVPLAVKLLEGIKE
jgi:hypothetical protein